MRGEDCRYDCLLLLIIQLRLEIIVIAVGGGMMIMPVDWHAELSNSAWYLHRIAASTRMAILVTLTICNVDVSNILSPTGFISIFSGNYVGWPNSNRCRVSLKQPTGELHVQIARKPCNYRIIGYNLKSTGITHTRSQTIR